jgi:dihydropteroate synthase
VERIASELDVVVSVDTSSPEVMIASAKVGAGLINDVRALRKEGALEAAAETNLPVCLMHMQGEPKTMQERPCYSDVVGEIEAFFVERIAAVEAAGIPRSKLLLDPGFGFGKTPQHNLALLKHMRHLLGLGLPLLAGLSRKSMIGYALNRQVADRLAGSLALAMLAVQNGASIIRVHDVAETVDVIGMLKAVESA